MYTSDLPLVKLEVSDVAPNRMALSQFWVICVCFDNILYYGLCSGLFIVIVILFWSFLQTLFSFWIIRFPLVSLPCVSLCLCDRCVPRPIMSPLICCSSTPLSVLRSFISRFIVKVICSMFSAFSLSSLVSSCLTCVNCVPHVFSVPSSLYCVFNPLPPSVQCCVLPHSCVFPRVLPHVFVIIFHSQQIKLCFEFMFRLWVCVWVVHCLLRTADSWQVLLCKAKCPDLVLYVSNAEISYSCLYQHTSVKAAMPMEE